MEHIVINQNSNVEIVDRSLIRKLAEEAQDCDISSNMTGNLQTDNAFRSDVSYLTTKFPGLTINVTGGYYKSFVDPAANEFFAKCPAGDGNGILETEFAKIYNQFGGDVKYTLVNNNAYFGNSETNSDYLPLSDILLKIGHFPEIVDLNLVSNGNTIGAWHCPLFKRMDNLVEAKCPRMATSIEFNFAVGQNLELIDMSDADNFTQDIFTLDGRPLSKLSKIILAPSITYFRHGTLVDGRGSSNGINIFAYATDLSAVPNDVSTWVLQSLPHVATLWVQDSVYNDWLQHKQIANNNNVVVKKFSEYTGDDLVQKWLEPSNE